MTNFWVMMCAMASGMAKLPGMMFFSRGAFTTAVSFYHYKITFPLCDFIIGLQLFIHIE